MVNTAFVAVSWSGLFESRLAATEMFSELSFSVDEDTLIPSSSYSGFVTFHSCLEALRINKRISLRNTKF